MTHRIPAPGEEIVYHVGHLASDATYKTEVADTQRFYIEAAGYRWTRAHSLSNNFEWLLRKAPQVILYQRRVAPGVCEYVALGMNEGRDTKGEKRRAPSDDPLTVSL